MCYWYHTFCLDLNCLNDTSACWLFLLGFEFCLDLQSWSSWPPFVGRPEFWPPLLLREALKVVSQRLSSVENWMQSLRHMYFSRYIYIMTVRWGLPSICEQKRRSMLLAWICFFALNKCGVEVCKSLDGHLVQILKKDFKWCKCMHKLLFWFLKLPSEGLFPWTSGLLTCV